MPIPQEIQDNVDAHVIAYQITGGLERAREQAVDPERTLVSMIVDSSVHYPAKVSLLRGYYPHTVHDITLGFLALDTEPTYYAKEVGHGREPLGHVAVKSVTRPHNYMNGRFSVYDDQVIKIPFTHAGDTAVTLGAEEADLAPLDILPRYIGNPILQRMTEKRMIRSLAYSARQIGIIRGRLHEEAGRLENLGYAIL